MHQVVLTRICTRAVHCTPHDTLDYSITGLRIKLGFKDKMGAATRPSIKTFWPHVAFEFDDILPRRNQLNGCNGILK